VISKELLLLQGLRKNDYIHNNYKKIVGVVKQYYGYKVNKINREYYIGDKYLDCNFSNGYLISYKAIRLENTFISNIWRKFISRIKKKDGNWYMHIEDFIYQLLIVYSVSQDYLNKIDIVIDMVRVLQWNKPVVDIKAIEYLRDILYYFTEQLVLTKQFTIYMHLKGSLFVNLQLFNLYFIKNKIGYFYVVNTDINDPLQLGMCLVIKRIKDDNLSTIITSFSISLKKAYDLSIIYWEKCKYNNLKNYRKSYIHNLYEYIKNEVSVLKSQYNVSEQHIEHGSDFRRNEEINGKILEIRKSMQHLPLLEA